ncbi:FxSxx-COOH system tetratricopeptide repeat protein [Winogradskya humida]|uniref:Tetratricopeptide repeat protein n=1 Tax=Winogradskya humida TaxID=113566 RepID=A0ABQ3ZW74_9ACTN|nr:FxSxx-COOH system tetratricopeptide repeat protein [Actinoplanes humidus]GIE22840.1 hypothetical protein Ahu01nite_059420 [Actinoplanes humidus]
MQPAGRGDHARDLRYGLVEGLVRIPQTTSTGDRRLLLSLIRRDTILPEVEEHPEARGHIVRIVVACLERPASLWALRAAIQAMAPDEAGTRRVCDLVESASLAGLLPEEDLKEGRDLLRRLTDTAGSAGWRAVVGNIAPQFADVATDLAGSFDHLVGIGGGVDRRYPALTLMGWAARTTNEPIGAELRNWWRKQSDRLGAPLGPALDTEAVPADTTESGMTPGCPVDGQGGDTHSGVSKIPTDSEENAKLDLLDNLTDGETGDDMDTAAATMAGAPRLPRVWGGVPPRNPNFTGRDLILGRLHQDLLEAREAAVLPQALHGMGGVGKSQVAIEYVHRHSGDYDLIWWIPAEQNSQVLASLTRLAQRLHLEVSPEANTAVPAVQDALNTGEVEYKRWLLVFDNAESLTDVRPYFPTGGAGKILVTSRNPEWSAVARSLEIDVFTREESRSFLKNRTPELSDADADRLAEALGDLPLAVEQAAAWHATTGMPVSEYLDLLKKKLLELLAENASPDYPLSVAAAWNVSLDRLEKTDSAALQLLQVCSFFSPEPISREFFGGALSSGIVEPLDETLKDPIKLARAIRAISRYALAKFNHRTNTLQIHRLVQAVLVSRMDEDQRDLMRAGAQALLASANPHSPGRRSNWDRYQAMLPHVRMSDALNSTDPNVLRLVMETVEFLYHWGDHRGCLEFAEEAYHNWLSKLGEDNPYTLRLAKFLGYVKALMGQYEEAAQLFERALELYRETVGADDEDTLDAQLLVAYSHRLQGDFKKAKELDEKTFLACRRHFDDDDPTTLRAAHNLGLSLRLIGDFTGAAKRDKETYERRQEILGNDDPDTLLTLRNYLVDRREAGEFVKAAQEQAAALKRTLAATADQNNPQVMHSTRNLAVARRKAGDHYGALELSGDALERFRRRYGDDFPDTMAAALNHAVDLRQTGDLEGARELGEETLKRYQASLSPLHPYTLSAQVNLAVVDRLLGQPQKAYRSNKAALQGLTEQLGKDHPTSLACATNIASDLFAMGDVQAAYEQDTDTLVRSEKTLGVEHPSTLAVGVNLVLDLRKLGREQEADLLHADTMARFRRSLGDQHPATLNALRSLRADCDLDPMPL